MENVISRFRNTANLIVLAAVLVLQVIGLAVQVQRKTESGSTRLIRLWAVSIVTPLTRSIIHTQGWFSETWHNYFWLRNVRKENEDLKNQIAQMRMQQVRLVEDANQARRLQLLLGFKETYISKTVPAQVISTTGSESSRAVYIDKGTNDGIKPDMPVVTPEGVVGKILRAYGSTSLVLLLTDPTSGAGVILEKSRLRGTLKGTPNGATVMSNIMSDEKVDVGERIVTSGGDKIYPKGILVGTVTSVGPGQDLFLNIRVRPAAPINRLEEVLVITQVDERAPDANMAESPVRAIDILAERLPSVAPPAPKPEGGEGSAATTAKPAVTGTTTPKTAGQSGIDKKTVPAGLNPVPKKTDTAALPSAVQPKPVKQAENTTTTKPQDPNPQDPNKDTPHQ